MTNTKDKYAELREASDAATDGPWVLMSTGKCYEWLGRLLADLDAANGGWISVEDRLPELSTHVITHYEELETSIVAEAFYFMDAFRVQGELVKPLNWMHLPSPPTDKGEPND